MEYKFTKDNFETEVLKSDKLVLIDFYADWCGPCRTMGPVVDQIAKDYEGKVKVRSEEHTSDSSHLEQSRMPSSA